MVKNLSFQSPLIIKYEKELAENPGSKVFAPLAEAYRKLGMLQEAQKVLRSGIRKNPSYTLGYLTLAACFFDLKNFQECYRILRPFVAGNLENIRLQRLFADSCYNLKLFDEALQTYKYILFLSPRDADVSIKVLELEKKLHKGALKSELTKDTDTEGEEDFWVQKDFLPSFDTPSKEDISDEEEAGNYILEESFSSASDTTEKPAPETRPVKEEIFTHTLVDLYLTQNHPEKAIEVLEKIIKLMPHDQRSIKRLELLKGQSASKSEGTKETLLDVFDKRVNKKSLQVRELENKFQTYLSKIKEKAKSYHAL